MRVKLLTLGCAVALALSACNRSAPQNDNRVASSNSNVAPTPTPQAFDSGQLDTEIARLEAEAEKNPDDDAARTTLAAAYVKRGDVLRAAHRNDEALRDYQNALRFNPDNEDAQLGLEQLNQEAGAAPRADDGKPVTVPAKKP